MSNLALTLNDFFDLQKKELTKVGQSGLEQTRKINTVKQKLSKEVANLKWTATFNQALEKIEDILGINVMDILLNSWNKAKILPQYLDKKKYPPEETIHVSLADHTIRSEHQPYIELVVNNKSIAKINFNVKLEILLQSTKLKIQDGKIKAVLTGSCGGKGSITCEGFEIVEKKLKSISLPGAIHLGDGIAIPPLKPDIS